MDSSSPLSDRGCQQCIAYTVIHRMCEIIYVNYTTQILTDKKGGCLRFLNPHRVSDFTGTVCRIQLL